MTEEKKQSLHETSRLLCEAYNLLVENGQVTFPLVDESISKIDSVVKTVYSHYYGVERYPTNEEKASAFFCLIIKDHPFTDGNKRTATLWLESYCRANDLTIQEDVPIDVLAVSVEKAQSPNLYNIIQTVKTILFK